MILISNSQRDDIVRYLTDYAVNTRADGTRGFNARRLARKLARVLEAKQPVPREQLPEQLRKGR